MEPFNLPRGSIRGFIILTLCGAFCYLLFSAKAVPLSMTILFAGVIGYYFGRDKFFTESESANPLYLPAGSVRIIATVLFLITAAILWREERLFKDPAVENLLALILGFGLGNVFRWMAKKFFKDEKSGSVVVDYAKHIFGIIVIVALLFSVIFIIANPSVNYPSFWRISVLSLITFYFGIRD